MVAEIAMKSMAYEAVSPITAAVVLSSTFALLLGKSDYNVYNLQRMARRLRSRCKGIEKGSL
jgi:hypothetical protein